MIVVNSDVNLQADRFLNESIQSIKEQKESKRIQVREAYDRLSFNQFQSNYGGLYGVKPNKSNSRIKDKFYSFSTYIDNNPRNYGLFPDNEVLIDVDNYGSSRMPSELQDAKPVEAKITDLGSNYININVCIERTNEKSLNALNRAFDSRESSVRIIPLLNPLPFDREMKSVNSLNDYKKDLLAVKHQLRSILIHQIIHSMN
jgi:hypothetical protein